MGGTGPENLNLTELDQPTRPRKVRFRPERGLEGAEPEFFEGAADYRGAHEGVGTEEQGDVGSPSSIMLATSMKDRIERMKRRLSPEPPVTMPNDKVERDSEERENMETSQSFYDMQAR